MEKIVPEKLRKGDEIRVIGPSRNMNILNDETIEIAKTTLESLGYKVTFSKNIRNSENDLYMCASIEDRIEDLHNAFKDKNVKAILTVIGGFNVNQILDYIDYELIRKNPKIICGYSDITALLDTITAKTGLVTYYGPHFSTFGIKKGNEYTVDYFQKMLTNNNLVNVNPSDEWSNDLWFLNQDERIFNKNSGIDIINTGKAKGKILGGNLSTINLLQGTPYMNKEKDVILFIEDDGMAGENFQLNFDRNLQSLVHCLNASNIKGIIVGRAEENCKMTYEKWKMIFETKKELKNIPIAVNLDFGHTNPMITFPIGGTAEIDINNNDIKISISD